MISLAVTVTGLIRYSLMGLLWNPRRHRSPDWGGRGRIALSCVLVVLFGGATPRPQVGEAVDPTVSYHYLCKFGIPKGTPGHYS